MSSKEEREAEIEARDREHAARLEAQNAEARQAYAEQKAAQPRSWWDRKTSRGTLIGLGVLWIFAIFLSVMNGSASASTAVNVPLAIAFWVSVVLVVRLGVRKVRSSRRSGDASEA